MVIPTPPPEHEIDGFGLPAEEQKFKRAEMPRKLKRLVLRSKTIDDVWESLRKHKEEYYYEILWIKAQWYYIINGYWFYNNGTPMYMHGFHYAYCCFWTLEKGLPDFRNRDRKFFFFAQYCLEETKTFAKRDAKGFPIQNEDGSFEMVETGRRVAAGFNYPKFRREGATSKACCFHYFFVLLNLKGKGGIVASDGNTAEEVFQDDLLPAWRELPFFLTTDYSGSTDPKSELLLRPPAINRTSKSGALANAPVGHGGKINYATTAHRNFYDQKKLIFLHEDECGKTVEENVHERHKVTLQCLLIGDEISGLTIKTSTVAEQKRYGGANFKKLCDDSMWERRNENGQTKSKLFNLFIPAEDGLPGFIDEYGMSVIKDPTPRQAAFIGKNYGAEEYLKNEEAAFIRDKDMEGLSEHRRLYPRKWRDAFSVDQKDSGFDMQILETRIDELDDMPNATRTGDFDWVGEKQRYEAYPRVEFIEKPDGLFTISYLPPEGMRNRIYKDGELWAPMDDNVAVHSCDPFMFNKVEGARKSNGGGAGFLNRDLTIDPVHKPVQEWQTHRFIWTYNTRVEDKALFADHMLRATIFYGGLMYPENNISVIEDYWIPWGFKLFLKFDIDPKTLKKKNRAGYHVGNNDVVKQNIFGAYMQYIKKHGHREKHKELLEQCREIPGIEKLKDYDLFAAGGGCLIAQQADFRSDPEARPEKKSNQKRYKLSDYFKTYPAR